LLKLSRAVRSSTRDGMDPTETTAGYLRCKRIPAIWNETGDAPALWAEHDVAMKRAPLAIPTEPTLLDLKRTLADLIFHSCHLCERRCEVDRETKEGWCRVGPSTIASEFLHYGEEPVLVPSHTVFFSGCTFSCVFCQNYDISQQQTGIHIAPQRLADIIKHRGGNNVNWVGGDPTPNIPYILRVLQALDQNVPQVWNSNMYCSSETMRILDGVMDIYLTDLKYGNNNCAQRFSGIPNYWEIVIRNHLLAHQQGAVIVRHLVMPDHIHCCSLPIIDWIAAHMPDVPVNIMDQYRPEYRACAYPEINRRVSPQEYRFVLEHAQDYSLALID